MAFYKIIQQLVAPEHKNFQFTVPLALFFYIYQNLLNFSTKWLVCVMILYSCFNSGSKIDGFTSAYHKLVSRCTRTNMAAMDNDVTRLKLTQVVFASWCATSACGEMPYYGL